MGILKPFQQVLTDTMDNPVPTNALVPAVPSLHVFKVFSWFHAMDVYNICIWVKVMVGLGIECLRQFPFSYTFFIKLIICTF